MLYFSQQHVPGVVLYVGLLALIMRSVSLIVFLLMFNANLTSTDTSADDQLRCCAVPLASGHPQQGVLHIKCSAMMLHAGPPMSLALLQVVNGLLLLQQQMITLPNIWSSALSLIDKFLRLQLFQPDAVRAQHSMPDKPDPNLVLPGCTVKPMTARIAVASSLVLLAARFTHQQHNKVTMLMPQDTAFAAQFLRLTNVLLGSGPCTSFGWHGGDDTGLHNTTAPKSSDEPWSEAQCGSSHR